MDVLSKGTELRNARKRQGVSQAKLAELSGIKQARISAFELGKNGLRSVELESLYAVLESLDADTISILKRKRYRSHTRNGNATKTRERRSYVRTPGNLEYLGSLTKLDERGRPSTKDAGRRPIAVSMFAGCGGLSYGVRASGFKIVAASELDEGLRKIYHLNFPETHFLSNDVRDVSAEECKGVLQSDREVDLLVGGPPCQGFSLAGKRDQSDSRNTLFYDYLRIANQLRPKVILMENVRLLTSMKSDEGGLVTDLIMEEFESIGYEAGFQYANAKDFGVPQHRDRVIYIAVRRDIGISPSFPSATHGETSSLFGGKQVRSFGDAVSDLEFIESGERSSTDPWHFAVTHPDHVIEWLIDVPQGKSAHENEDPGLRPPSGYNTTYKRQVWDEPGATVATTFGMISGCRNVHPIATRSLTIREALRLQSFPDSFNLAGKLGTIRTGIGNAVPPILAAVIATHIRDTYIL